MNEESNTDAKGLSLIIFGATGDLSRRKLLPALFDLYLRGYLPKHFRIIGVSRRDCDERAFRDVVKEALVADFRDPPESDVSAFLEHFFYLPGAFEAAQTYRKLQIFLRELDTTLGACPHWLFYLAVPPNFYESMFDLLSESGLVASKDGAWSRILVEKPFGSDSETARVLDSKLGRLFEEEQIFRIDHYLAKASVQNILAFRFSNALFEETWSARHIERVHIKLYESGDVKTRGEFYDGIGALRDVGQNHILQMLAMVAMENPHRFDGEALSHARRVLLEKLILYTPEIALAHSLFGQYDGYKETAGVKPESTTETYFKVTAQIDNDRWRGVPFTLESGKGLSKTIADITVWFKAPEEGVCHSFETDACHNVVTIGINPAQYVSVRLWGRKPGLHFELEPHDLRFDLPAGNNVRVPDAYAKVLYDGIAGDRTLFMSTQELEASWKFISPILAAWKDKEPVHYELGSDPATITK